MLNSGPPELPRLIGASVWMKSSYGPSWMSRPRAEMMPAVTEPPSPNGLPIASTQSPMRMALESPNSRAGSGLSGFTFSNAMSPAVSRPTTVAFNEVLSCRVTVISSAPSITWLLVTTSPDGSMMNPDPRLCIRRSSGGGVWSVPPPGRWRFMKSLKNCSNGEPGGNIGMSGPAVVFTSVVEDMLTTAGSSFAARSAKLSGAGRAYALATNCGAASGRAANAEHASATARNVRTEGSVMGGWSLSGRQGRCQGIGSTAGSVVRQDSAGIDCRGSRSVAFAQR